MRAKISDLIEEKPEKRPTFKFAPSHGTAQYIILYVAVAISVCLTITSQSSAYNAEFIVLSEMHANNKLNVLNEVSEQ